MHRRARLRPMHERNTDRKTYPGPSTTHMLLRGCRLHLGRDCERVEDTQTTHRQRRAILEMPLSLRGILIACLKLCGHSPCSCMSDGLTFSYPCLLHTQKLTVVASKLRNPVCDALPLMWLPTSASRIAMSIYFAFMYNRTCSRLYEIYHFDKPPGRDLPASSLSFAYVRTQRTTHRLYPRIACWCQ